MRRGHPLRIAGRLLRTGAVASLVSVGLAVCLIAASSAWAHAARTRTIRTGDWETHGTVTASFAVVKRRRGWRLTNFVYDAPRLCSGATTVDGLDLLLPQNSSPIPIHADGRFSVQGPAYALTLAGRRVVVQRTLLRGMFAAAGRARITFAETDYSLSSPGTVTCRFPRTTFVAHPGRRTAIQDGGWTGTAANGEPVFFEVVGDGRAISGAVPVDNPPSPPMLFVSFLFGAPCTSAGGGSYTCPETEPVPFGGPLDLCLHGTTADAMIGADGTATVTGLQDFLLPSFYGPGVAYATITFTGPRSATGTYTQPDDPSCTSTFTATPSLALQGATQTARSARRVRPERRAPGERVVPGARRPSRRLERA